jgi:ribosomal-protein-alanine N-acetyltransferase
VIEINFTPFPIISTERLNLRKMNDKDKNEIFDLRSDENVSKYIDRPIAKSVEEALQYIEMINAGINRNDWVLWAITEKDNDKLIGTICIWNFSKEEAKGEVGYELSPKYQGMGIMQEAITAVLKYGFEKLKLKTIEGYVNQENIKSIQLLEKNQFSKVGMKEKSEGEKSNSVIYSLKNSRYSKFF